MKKKDLVAGKHMVQYRNGNVRFVGEYGILLDSTGSYMNALNSYDESLLFNNGGKLLDIVAVYEVNRVWKREDPTITEDEKAILRNLPVNYEWIARDEDSRLYIYLDKPEKREDAWMGKLDHRSLGALSLLFGMVRWEDDEPWKIDDLLKLDVKKDG